MDKQTNAISFEEFFEAGKLYKVSNNKISHHFIKIGTEFTARASHITFKGNNYRYQPSGGKSETISILEVDEIKGDGLVRNTVETPSGIVYSLFFKKEESRFITSTACYVGKIKVCEYYYDGARSKGLPPLKVISQMVGIKSELGHFSTDEEAEAKCMSVARTFVKMLHNKPE